MVSSAEGASAPPQSPERMILQAAASVQPCPSHDSGGVPPATCLTFRLNRPGFPGGWFA